MRLCQRLMWAIMLILLVYWIGNCGISEIRGDEPIKPHGLPFDRALFQLTDGFWATRHYGYHHSWDCALQEGTPIYAIMPGKVHVKANKQAGLLILIENGFYLVGHYHMLEPVVLSGQEVHYGQLIGFSGNSGSESTGPHLHYFVEFKGIRQNPQNFIK